MKLSECCTLLAFLVTVHCQCSHHIVSQNNSVDIECQLELSSFQHITKEFLEIQGIEDGRQISSLKLQVHGKGLIYVDQDIFGGLKIPEVTFTATDRFTHSIDVIFHTKAFKAKNGECTLSGNITFDSERSSAWDLSQLDGEIFSNCHQLKSIEITAKMASLFNFPQLDGLETLHIKDKSGRWKDFEWVHQSTAPKLTKLVLEGGQLTDEDIGVAWFSQLKSLRHVKLQGNFSTVPDLTDMSFLEHFDMVLDRYQANMSLLLPSSRTGQVPLNVRIASPFIYKQLDAFKGEIKGVNVSLQFGLRYFDESVFRRALPLITDGGLILSKEETFYCSCDMAWLIRDHRHLLSDNLLDSGFCTNGKSFASLRDDDFSCCVSEVLSSRYIELVERNKQLKIKQKKLEELAKRYIRRRYYDDKDD